MNPYLHAFGAWVPKRVVTNSELAERLGCTPEWIENASGIRERRWATATTSIVDLGAEAALACMARAGLSASEIGLVVLASGSAPPGFPAPAAALAARLGLGTTPAIDLPMASAGSLFGLALASRLAETYGNVLVVAAEKMSAIIERHPLDPNTAMLFGDGAGAALVSDRPGKWQIMGHVLHSDGQFSTDLAYDWNFPLHMNGLSVILQATRKMPAAIKEVLERAEISATDISVFLLHQANQNLLVRVGKTLGVAPERVFSNISRYGNTSSASMLIAAAEWSEQAPVPGPIVFAAFGAGVHWGALVAK
ncbi:MAG: ketoacyl-ACP synthase III [Bryobacterales bacterium]|nr:ketoacyl-ACP synthase III [Bryobacterales bacterium]MBV9396539.1 ketoacyl-ACP synthase III [Bryobacterales bacterium]